MSDGDPARPERAAQRKLALPPVNLLLLVPLIGVLIPPIFNHREPELLGFPFFYWYQLVWVPLSVLCTIVVYRATKGKR
jgi:hypothetical protein